MTDTMTLPRSVAMQALEALKIGHESAHDCAETFHIEMAGYKQQRHEALDAEVKQISDAIGVLRAALEQSQVEQEPVAWQSVEAMAAQRYKVVPSHDSMFYRHAVIAGDGTQQLYIGREAECENMARKFSGAFLDGAHVALFHTRPQPQREPLTDEEIRKIGNSLPEEHRFHSRMFARAIERAHGIGGDA